VHTTQSVNSSISDSVNNTQQQQQLQQTQLSATTTQHTTTHIVDIKQLLRKKMKGRRTLYLIQSPDSLSKYWVPAESLPTHIVAEYLTNAYKKKAKQRARRRATVDQH
jgi:hypothetical protein